MNKSEFLGKLNKKLKDIPECDKKDILFDYDEHFAIGLEQGRNEEEIAESLGSPDVLAKQLKVNHMINQAENTSSIGNIFKAVFATLGLGFFNLVFILGPFLGIVGVFIGLFAASGATVISGVAIFAAIFAQPFLPNYINIPFNPIVSIFLSIGVTALGILLTIGSCYLAKAFYKLTIKYLKMNLNIISNKK